MDEQEALDLAREGDHEGHAELYRRHRRRVYALCLRMTRNAADADDLAQDVWLRVFQKIGTFRGESAFSTWVHRLSVNVVLMHLRRKSLPEAPLDEFTEPVHEDAPRREFGARDQNLAGAIDRVNLERALARLSPGHRTVVVLHDVEGRPLREVAALTGASVSEEKSKLWRARIALCAAVSGRGVTSTGR